MKRKLAIRKDTKSLFDEVFPIVNSLNSEPMWGRGEKEWLFKTFTWEKKFDRGGEPYLDCLLEFEPFSTHYSEFFQPYVRDWTPLMCSVEIVNLGELTNGSCISPKEDPKQETWRDRPPLL